MSAVRLLVTGAGGFLGSAVVRRLARSGAEIRALVRTPRSAADLLLGVGDTRRIEILVGSLDENAAGNSNLLAGCDVVVHAAGALGGSASMLVRQNAVATRHLVLAATRLGLRRFVLVSSLAVYGTGRLRAGDVLDESCPLDAESERRSSYSYSKILQERCCWEAHHNARLPLVVLRPGVIFGPGRSCLTDRVGPCAGRWIALVGPARPLPYTFIENCAEAVTLAALGPAGLDGESFNIVDDELPTGRQIVRRCRRAGVRVRTVAMPAVCAPLVSRAYARWYRWCDGMLPPVFLPAVVEAMYKPLRFSNERAKSRLGWKPVTDLETALDRTFAVTR